MVYLTCPQCKKTSHISLWKRLEKVKFACPICGFFIQIDK